MASTPATSTASTVNRRRPTGGKQQTTQHRAGPIPTREMYPITEARQLLGGMSHSGFYDRVKEGLIPLICIGRRRYVSAETIRRITGA